MIERLVLARAPVGGDRLVPFVGIVELRIDVEDHATKRIESVANNLTNLEFGDACLCHVRGDRPGLRPILVPRTEAASACELRNWDTSWVKVRSARPCPGPWRRPAGQG